jgi:hypothetical protein
MPKTDHEIEILRIFVASPSDVGPERAIVSKAVDELNQSIGPGMHARFEVWRWEKDAQPALGTDPQEIINSQVEGNYHVFIGILWTQFGTPTPRAESGTIEEFQRAREKYHNDPKSVSVMFYFKSTPVSPFEIDLEQMAKVLKFKNDLGKEAIYGTFNTQEEFGSNVRIHLSRILLERRGLHQGTPAASHKSLSNSPQDSGGRESETSSESRPEEEGEDEGLLDLVARAQANIGGSTAVIDRMASHLQSLTDSIHTATADIKTVDASKGPQELQRAMTIVNGLGDKMNSFSDQIQLELSAFETVYSVAMRAIEKSALILPNFGDGSKETLNNNLKAIRTMADAIQPARESMLGLRNSVEQLPPITTKFKEAQARIHKALSDVDRQFSAAHTLTSEIIKLIEAQILA